MMENDSGNNDTYPGTRDMRKKFVHRTLRTSLRKVFATLVMSICMASLAVCAMETTSQDSGSRSAGTSPSELSRWCQALMSRRELVAGTPRNPEHRNLNAAGANRIRRDMWYGLALEMPVPSDWVRQDFAVAPWDWLQLPESTARDVVTHAIEKVRRELDSATPSSGETLLETEIISEVDIDGLNAALRTYVELCEVRRSQRLRTALREAPRIIFSIHHTMGGSHYAYTEAQSDAQNERTFIPGARLCLLRLAEQNDAVRAECDVLLADDTGVIRDADVSFDGDHALFAWKKTEFDDDYHLYEMDISNSTDTAPQRPVRQITSGEHVSDIEPTYLPSGDILFASTRCVQTVDCWWTEVSNLYTCAPDGRFLRRLTFDQVHDTFPTPLNDGRVAYTRWEYNDRGQIFPQALFAMNPDGTAQAEVYGNSSWFPTTILHARSLPDSARLIAVASGHHSRQTGKLIVIDPSKGRQENSGVQLVSPVRETPAVRVDSYGQDGELFQYPYPIAETEYLVSYHPDGWDRSAKMAIYWFCEDGRREILYEDPHYPCNKPIPAVVRSTPPMRPSTVDYTKTEGTVYMQNVYMYCDRPLALLPINGDTSHGDAGSAPDLPPTTGTDLRLEGDAAMGRSLAGVPRGTVKTLRVVTMEFRPVGIGSNGNSGPAGGALSSTPVSICNGAWDPKRIIGDVPVHEDGSASFTVPARTPVYFQLLDENGRMIQTMRSWTTLQPGEVQSCVGCHEHKCMTPEAGSAIPLALRSPPAAPQPLHGDTRWFSYNEQIQPILDVKCVSCHDGKKNSAAPNLTGERVEDPAAKRYWARSYLTLTEAKPENPLLSTAWWANPDCELVNWISTQSVPSLLPPYPAGSNRSQLMTLLDENHFGAELTREEKDRFAAWIDLGIPFCGDYAEAGAWTPDEQSMHDHFMKKRELLADEDRKNIREMLESQ